MKKMAILIALLMAALLISPGSAWLSGYPYRQMLNITGDSLWSSNETYYPYRFLVNNTTGISYNTTAYTNGHSQPDWDDVRFTSLGDVEYDYFIEERTNTATTCVFWVEIPEIANSSVINTSLYMYYGNPFATNSSNATNVFSMWEDFQGSVSLWGNSTNEDHLYPGSSHGTIQTNAFMIDPLGTSIVAQQYTTHTGGWVGWHYFRINRTYPVFTGTYAIGAIGKSDSTQNSYHRLSMAVDGVTLLDSAPSAINTWQAFSYTNLTDPDTIAVGQTYYYYTSGLTSYWDNIFLRNYTYPEPAVIWWSSEDSGDAYIEWSEDTYALGEDASISTTFPATYWDTVNYTYYVTIFKYPDLTHPIDSYNIPTMAYDKTLHTEDYGVGAYYAMAYIIDTATGTTFLIDYDYSSFVNGVTISGIVFNATSGESISGATVDVIQGTSASSYTSTVAGYATTNPLNIGQAIIVNGSMVGYTPYTSTFTPLGAANITKSIPLVSTDTECYWNVTYNSTAITGLVDELPYYVPANGAYVNLSNATWYSNLTLGVTGWYLFEDLDNGTAYTLTSGKEGFNDYAASITSGADNLTWYNYTLGASFTLTVYVKDAASGAPLTSNVTIEITNTTGSSDSETTTTGSATFTDLAGTWDISASCIGYTEGTASVNMDADKSVTISLSTPSVSNVYYTPHDVKMVVQDAYGNPIDGATMTITPISTTLDSWDWLQSVLGIPAAAAADTTVQTGTTDYMGSATFVLVKEIRYQIDINSITHDVDDTYYLYPKDDMYIFTVGVTGGYEDPTNPVTNMTWSFTNTTVNSTHENITFAYYDSGGTTTSVLFWVKTHSSPVTTVYQTYCTNPNNCGAYYVAAASNGQEYYVGADITCADGSCYNFTQAFAFQKLVNLGISSAYYPWIAAAFLIVIGAIFSVISVRFGAVLVPIFAWMFFYMKWLTLTWQQSALLTILLVIGVFAYVRKQEDKVGG